MSQIEAKITARNFRTSPDVENFYRFISENLLRNEARQLLKLVIKNTKGLGRKTRRKKSKK